MSHHLLSDPQDTILREALILKKNGKKGDIVPFWEPPPERVKGDICCLITAKGA